MSGRIAAIDAVAGRPLTIYVGAAGGGVWKSDRRRRDLQAGLRQVTCSRSAPSPSIPRTRRPSGWARASRGCATAPPSATASTSPPTAAITGSGWASRIPSASPASPGRPEADRQHGLGLRHRPPLGRHPDRGVYKTTDGGKTWKKVLYVDADTGCSDLAIDPQDPTILYAGMWQFRRTPWFFHSGGPGSGLYKSTDGGETWKKTQERAAGRRHGAHRHGRGAVAAERGLRDGGGRRSTALYPLRRLGESWREVNTSFNVQARPFYFARTRGRSRRTSTRVYKPGLSLDRQRRRRQDVHLGLERSGLRRSARRPSRAVDQPAQPERGAPRHRRRRLPVRRPGRAVAVRGGAAGVAVLPRSYDMDRPYNVYGGLQDNGSWCGPSRGPGPASPTSTG